MVFVHYILITAHVYMEVTKCSYQAIPGVSLTPNYTRFGYRFRKTKLVSFSLAIFHVSLHVTLYFLSGRVVCCVQKKPQYMYNFGHLAQCLIRFDLKWTT